MESWPETVSTKTNKNIMHVGRLIMHVEEDEAMSTYSKQLKDLMMKKLV